MISRHISIDEEYFDRIKPYIEKHNGSLGAALREIINQVEMYNSYTNIDTSLSDWIFKEAEGRLVPDSVIDEIIDPNLINSMKKLDEYLNDRFSKSEWNININLEADGEVLPSHILVDIRGSSPKISVVAGILSKYLIRHSSERSPLGIKSVTTFDESIRIEFCMMDKNKSIESLSTFFGSTDDILKIIKEKPTFWKTIIERHVISNYNMVTIHRNHLEELLANDMSILGEITIEILKKKVIQDIPLTELLNLIKYTYENSRIVDIIEIDKHDMIVYHSYRNQKAIDKLKTILVALLENSGHLYDAKSTSNSIILKYKPDIDIKLDQIISNLKISESDIDQELAKFIICLNGLKDMSDLGTLSLTSLGRKIGKSLMQEYEKEEYAKEEHEKENNQNQNKENQNKHDSYNWDMKKFKKAIEAIDLKFHRISEWKLENGNILYIIKKCNIAKDENKINPYICRTIREIFKGALDYAFGDKVKLEIKKLISHGDNYCEVIIRTK